MGKFFFGIYLGLSTLCTPAHPVAEDERTLASCDVVLLAGQVVGCRGTWTRGPQCPAGWRACTSLPAAAQAACQSDLKGFFVADVGVGHAGDLQCGAPRGADYYGLAGCGTKPQLGATEPLSPPCAGFGLAVACQPTTGYLCGAAGLSTSSNQFSRNGVLCCK